MASPESSQSLLEWLATRYPDTPRKRLKDWFHIGRVRLDGRTVVRFQDIVEDPGERLVLAERASGLGPVSSGIRLHQLLRLAHLDGGIAVVNKSPGLLSVPAPQRQEPSALDLLRKHLERSKARQEEPFPVHRLDEYTSGLLCFALTREAREHLIEQVRSHRLERTYLAFCDGSPSTPAGSWVDWLLLDEKGVHQRIVPADTPGAEKAVTHFEVLATYHLPHRTVSKIRVSLETGLKHQIRLQAAEAGCPLMGDRTYNPLDRDRTDRGSNARSRLRQALHAVRLGMVHPLTGEHLVFEAPLPKDLSQLEADWRAQVRGRSNAPRGGRHPR